MLTHVNRSTTLTLAALVTPHIITAIASPWAMAHTVQTDYAVSGQARLEIRVTFSTGDAFPNAPVVIYSPSDPTVPWLEGVTDGEGQFAFEADRAIPGEWRLEVGQADHADILSIPVNRLGIDVNQISEYYSPDEKLARHPLPHDHHHHDHAEHTHPAWSATLHDQPLGGLVLGQVPTDRLQSIQEASIAEVMGHQRAWAMAGAMTILGAIGTWIASRRRD